MSVVFGILVVFFVVMSVIVKVLRRAGMATVGAPAEAELDESYDFESENEEHESAQCENPYYSYEYDTEEECEAAPVHMDVVNVEAEPVEPAAFDLRQAVVHQTILQNKYIESNF